MNAGNSTLSLLDRARLRTGAEDRALADACQKVLWNYRRAVVRGTASRALKLRARRAFLHLGGDPARPSTSLKDYDHLRYGPFLGISDEGSAATQIRAAALESPKVRALPKTLKRTPFVVGVALDAERLASVGEVAVGPGEYADVWLDTVDRLLITTNIGTRVNVRVYRREPWVIVKEDSRTAVNAAKREIASAFKPFIQTPDRRPRPLTVFIDIPRYAKITEPRKRALLKKLVHYVSSGNAAGRGKKTAPKGQELGLATWVRLGIRGRDAAIAAINLAASVGMRVVIIDGVKRKIADRAVSLAGLLDYFAPGHVGPILRCASKHKIQVRTANLPDTDTIARSTWVGLTTARNYGANLGKYGCFPLTFQETDHVIGQVQEWLSDWSAAPVFFVDQGLLRDGGVDVGHDLLRGLRYWLRMVANHDVRLVLIDTIDKATGKRLLKKSAGDDNGFLGPKQIHDVEDLARELKLKILWAGGLDLRDAYQMGKLGVFGVYVTSAAATTIAVTGSYTRDPSLAGVKEPSKEAVLRTKILLEAGFLCGKLPKNQSQRIESLSEKLLHFHENNEQSDAVKSSAELASECVKGWRDFWDDTKMKVNSGSSLKSKNV